MLIASLNFPNAKPLPVVAAYLVFSNLAAIPYMRWRAAERKAQVAAQSNANAAQQ
jgi:BASS family bile acid:Na+ symporter